MIKFGKKKKLILYTTIVITLLSFFTAANYYISDIYFVIPTTVYTTGEQISLKGYLYETNYSDNGTIISSSSGRNGYSINLTIKHKHNNTYVSNYTFTTDTYGAFYSNSTYSYNYTTITAPNTEGDYKIRAQYIDGNNSIKYSEVEFRIVNQSVDTIKISTEKSTYNPSQTTKVEVHATKKLGDKTLYINNITINGTLRNNTKGVVQSFNCTTNTKGKCTVSLTAPSAYGKYYVETNNFKAYSSFSVIPFQANVYMKDELGKSYKNTFVLGEQASVEVDVIDNTTTASYNFSGYITDSSGNVIQTINSTLLNSSNSYTNKFVFIVNSLTFSYGTYFATVNIQKSGDGNRTETASFEVKDWKITFNKKTVDSGFEYEYSTFPNNTLRFEAHPKYRSNASVIPALNKTSFSVNLTDELNNNLESTNVSWNATCGGEGCYEFLLTSPLNTGKYSIRLELSHSGSTQTVNRQINVINKVVQAQSTDSEGNIKELFGTGEAAYITLSSYNKTEGSINLSDIEVFTVTYMNGTQINYTNVSNFDNVNTSNTQLEWAVNQTLQRIKIDVPKYGGVYDVYIFAENKTVAGVSKFVMNPYDICVSAKNTPGTVSSASGQYYVWQFKTTDTVYFELKAIQANNPLGKASVSNFSSNSTNGALGSACTVNTQTQQVVNNATISIVSVKNTNNGATYSLNTTSSVCIASDTSGGYTCTVEPSPKWDGGTYTAEMKITGPDGQTQDTVYGFFEARAFYLYGWSQTWQNKPSNNITLTVQMYEAGRNWWGSYGSGGLSGSVSVEKIEYQGRDGEWIWPPINYAYNTSAINSTSLTTGQGTLTLPVEFAPQGNWKTGYYRVILKGTDSNGNTDYGYAWFGVKKWNVYGSPIDCSSSDCYYKSYFNSRENVTIYVQVSNAGDYNYNYNGGEDLGGNITIKVKKIEDCRTWPCKELNNTHYNSTTIIINQSNRWYWNANASNSENYTIRINRTSGNWNTGSYNVVLDVNGTETGGAWFNTIAFYVDSRPTNKSGDTTTWHYDIKNNEAKYYNISTVKSHKGWGVTYNASDYLNTTVTSLILRGWDETTYTNKEYTYPTDINISPTQINGTSLLNITYNNGSWPSGYYWGELILNNSQGETSTGWLSFSVRPFRVSTSVQNYEVDSRSCANVTLQIYEPSWSSNKLLNSNYTIQEAYETVWNGGGSTKTTYTNYSNLSFTNQTNFNLCPNNAKWSSGSWGGYHYINLIINDTQNNYTQSGWLSFRTKPFSISWSSVIGGSSQKTNANVNVTVNVLRSSVAAPANITKIYQWRYNGFSSTLEEYNFTVRANASSGVTSCNSWTSPGGCKVNGSTTITITAPSTGWTIGGNYLYSEWTEEDDVTATVQDWYGVYINGQESYNGFWTGKDESGQWKTAFRPTQNLSTTLTIRDINYNNIAANITAVYYAAPSSGCYDEYCRTYTEASWSVVGGGSELSSSGTAFRIHKPSGDWARGEYYIKVHVSGSAGTGIIKGGRLDVKSFEAPNVTINTPTINSTITGSNFTINLTTTKTASCYMALIDYDRFYSWSCGSANASNSSSAALTEVCNKTVYNLNGSYYRNEYISKDYHSVFSEPNNSFWYQSGSSGLSTDSTNHIYLFNTTDKITNTEIREQDYTLQVWCYDNEWNQGSGYSAFTINITG